MVNPLQCDNFQALFKSRAHAAAKLNVAKIVENILWKRINACYQHKSCFIKVVTPINKI